MFQLEQVLRHLELGGNKLKTIPSYLGNFCSLKQVHLTENLIGISFIIFLYMTLLDFLPDEIGQLKTLEVLDVSSNKLKDLPSTLSACFALKILKAANNLLTTFPLSACDLPNLDDLDLSKNTIEFIPDEVRLHLFFFQAGVAGVKVSCK